VVTATEYLDSVPSFGVTYYYVVVAVDNAGNESDHSNEASVTMADTLPPAAPVFFSPTTSGKPLNVDTRKVSIAGWAEPLSTVELTRNGTPTGTTTASSTSTISRSFTLNMNGYYEDAALSPDGRLLAYTPVMTTPERCPSVSKTWRQVSRRLLPLPPVIYQTGRRTGRCLPLRYPFSSLIST